VTYRDTEDALRARIQSLESKLDLRSQERAELQQELAQAHSDLAALHPTEQKRPVTLLILGVVGSVLALASLALHHLIPIIGYSRWLFQSIYIATEAGLGLGLVGFYIVTRQRLALTTAILLFVGPPIHLVMELANLGPYSFTPGWLLNLAMGVVLALTLLRAPVEHLRPWKRNLTGALFLVGVLIGTLSLALFMVQVSRDFDQSLLGLNSYIAIPSSIVSLVKHVGLLLCFLELRRPARQWRLPA